MTRITDKQNLLLRSVMTQECVKGIEDFIHFHSEDTSTEWKGCLMGFVALLTEYTEKTHSIIEAI